MLSVEPDRRDAHTFYAEHGERDLLGRRPAGQGPGVESRATFEETLRY